MRGCRVTRSSQGNNNRSVPFRHVLGGIKTQPALVVDCGMMSEANIEFLR